MEHKTKRLILGFLSTLAILFFFYRGPIQTSYADDIPQSDVVQYEIPAMVSYYAEKYEVSDKLAQYIADHESQYNPNETGDLGITCREKGSPDYGKAVYARGVFQITRCYYPQVSDQLAFDPQFNIDYAMQIISKGKSVCMSQFSTCRDYYNL